MRNCKLSLAGRRDPGHTLPALPESLELQGKPYRESGRTRRLFAFGIADEWDDRTCAFCGLSERRYKEEIWASRDYFGSYRVFPGPLHLMDGFIAICDDCARVTEYHDEPTGWDGVGVLRPVGGSIIEVSRYRYADDSRVAGIFANVWKAIPGPDRHRIDEYIEGDDRSGPHWEAPVARGQLRIETLPAWPCWQQPEALGLCGASGHVIRIRATAARNMGPLALHSLLAHELAHTYQHAIGTKQRSSSAADNEIHEADAKEIAARWGYPDAAIDRWTD